ncbi:AAA family ATPase [Paenibacillus sp. ACRRX]|uniref:AAA family ATPase n=1 Tax=Paenibacillus sp. ACRRX TaxID=2918206 RepID=UPI001EF4E798|nr:AAA family ATPase [Paenibacillus sp. ACRRX]MCG7410011.1 AAA family ATPase [Paenibacillus sp. ACRRX]
MDIMKRHAALYLPTRLKKPAYSFGSKWERSDGGIILEAAILLPMVLLLFLFFIYMIQAALIATALQSSASNSVKMVAAHMYPVVLALQNDESSSGGSHDNKIPRPPAMAMRLTVNEFGQKFGNMLPHPAADWVQDIGQWAGQYAESLGEQAQAVLGQALFQPLLARYGVQGVLTPSRIRVTHLKLPDLKEKKEPYIALELEYDLPMRVPLLMNTVTLKARAAERVWIGDSPLSGSVTNPTQKDKPIPQIIRLEPNPLKPWGMARLIAKAAPHERIKLMVYYKSGESIAKGLEWKHADAEGNVVWEWNVSGHTSAGIWRLQVITESGMSADMNFQVQ